MNKRMKATEIIEKLRVAFAELTGAQPPVPPAPPAPQVFGYKLADGTEIEVSGEVAPGSVVTIQSVPAPAGEHVLEDGTKIEVAEAGVITEVEAPEPAEPAAPVVDEEMKKKMDEMQAAQAAFAKQTSQRIDQLIATNEKYREMFAQMLELTEALAKAPVAPADPAVQKDQFAAQPKDWAHAASQLVTKKTK
jgi:hypothetical protein